MGFGYWVRTGFGTLAATFGAAIFLIVLLLEGPAMVASGEKLIVARLLVATLIFAVSLTVIFRWPPLRWWHAPIGALVFAATFGAIWTGVDYLFGGPLFSGSDLSKIGQGPLAKGIEHLLGEEGLR